MIGNSQTSHGAKREESFICVMRAPFVDKIPGLRSLLHYLSEDGYRIELLCPTDDRYLAPSFLNEKLKFTEINRDLWILGCHFRIPTTVKLFFQGRQTAIRSRPLYILGADKFGIIAAAGIAKTTRLPIASFCVEFPAIRHDGSSRLQIYDYLEHVCLRSSDLVITQDRGHASLLTKEIGVKTERIAVLPNSSRGLARKLESNWLPGKFGFPSDSLIILHSGGLGRYFECLELARATRTWPESWRLVFHTSLKMEGAPYLQAVRQESDPHRVVFSTNPVPANELDLLVSSAHIGVALYSVEELGYRAELMGLAAGKIGQYLKCGLPVVASDIPTLRNYLEEYRCGICIRSAGEVKYAIECIMKDYDSYSENAIRCFNELWEPDKYCSIIADRLKELVRSELRNCRSLPKILLNR